MKSNYKRLGNYIKEVKFRNTELKAEKLLGINIDKFFMPSVANVIGTDMSVYKIVKKNQFACNRMHVGRDYRLPVALSKSEYDFMVSPAYDVFEIKDTKELLPEYLMMWFTRREFDRNAWFYTDADVRGGLHWKALCDMQLPIPHPNKQKEIVKEYNVIQNRIALNQQLIQKLEETAQAIYKHWFIEFEFPNENGKPYKSSGGEMVERELGEIPKGWELQGIGNYVKLTQGFVMNATTTHLVKEKGLPLLRITDLLNDTVQYYIDEKVDKKNIALKEDIIISRTGQVGLIFRNKIGVVYNNCFKIAPIDDNLDKEYLYWFLCQTNTFNSMVELASGSSAQFDLTHTAFNTMPIILPSNSIQKKFRIIVRPINNHLDLLYNENKILKELKDLLLSKLATIEN
jgi:type I restriction enzyme S subunit